MKIADLKAGILSLWLEFVRANHDQRDTMGRAGGLQMM